MDVLCVRYTQAGRYMEVERDMLVCPLCGGWGGRGIAVSR